MKKALTFIKDNLLILIGLLVLLMGLITVFSKYFRSLFASADPIPDYFMSEAGAVISNDQAKAKAEALYNAMNQLGTDEDLIFSVFKGLNKGDFSKVYNQFGKRDFIEFLGVGTNDNMLSVKFDLIGWLKHDLTNSEYLLLKSTYPDFF